MLDRPIKCDGGGAVCPGCDGGADVGAGYGSGLSFPRASWMDGSDCRGACLSLSSSSARRDSGDEIYPGCEGALVAGAHEYGWPVYMLLGLISEVGDPVLVTIEEWLGAYPEPSLPRKPIAGKGSLCPDSPSQHWSSDQGEGGGGWENKPVPCRGFQRPHHVQLR